MPSLDTPIKVYAGSAKVKESALARLGVETIRDLIFYFPFRYEDLSNIMQISELKIAQTATVKGRIDLIHNKRSPRRRMYITEALISDQSGTIKIVWFNQPFMGKVLKVGDMVFISGKVDNDYVNLQFTNPAYEKISRNRKQGSTLHTARIVPVYPTTQGISSKQLRLLMQKSLRLAPEIEEWVPDEILDKYNLMALHEALHAIHFPPDRQTLDHALDRLKFDELFVIQLYSQRLRNNVKSRLTYNIEFNEDLTKDFVNKLPFELTDAQRRAGWEILQDIEGANGPMNRLLEGDVGSGKTVVAALSLLNVFHNSYQSCVLAPTEILAEQHFNSLSDIFSSYEIRIGLLTRNSIKYHDTKCHETINLKKTELINKIKKNDVDIIIGTHTLLQDSVDFLQIGLIIVDEQHRFGVKQRQIIKEKAESGNEIWPHFLSMTATPIPRSLALALYGDLDISIINQMPLGRKPVDTRLVKNSNHDQAYEFIKDQIQQGRQCFIICPLVSESDKLGVKSVEQEYEKLDKDVFPDLKIGKLHGKLKKDEKSKVMNAFSKGEIDILISTSVVEVGVDIPNATIMMIEGSDRFGMAQLHQFRGRVGRSDHQSYCFLFTDNESEEILQRLEDFTQCNNGFEIAEKDLQRRGPGEVYGYKQSGVNFLKLANLGDHNLIKKTRDAACFLLENTDDIEDYDGIMERLNKMEQLVDLE